jgi:hypothetical protein
MIAIILLNELTYLRISQVNKNLPEDTTEQRLGTELYVCKSDFRSSEPKSSEFNNIANGY